MLEDCNVKGDTGRRAPPLPWGVSPSNLITSCRRECLHSCQYFTSTAGTLSGARICRASGFNVRNIRMAQTRLRRWYLTIPSSDQWWTTIENHRYQWLPDPKTIGKPSFPMIACNHSIQWWWYPWKPLELCNGSKYWLKTRTELLQMSGKVPI